MARFRSLGHALAHAWVLAGALGLASASAQAARVASVTPQGEVPLVRQVVVRFDRAVVPAGDPRRPAPFALRCGGQAQAGDARWSDERTWLVDLREPIAAGQRCSLVAEPGFQPLGGPLEGSTEFGFAVAGPAVVQVQPWEGAQIEEDQHFLLRLTGAADAASVQRHASCEIEGLAERVPVRVVDGAERQAVLNQRRIVRQPERWLLLACTRPLPAEAGVRLVWGAGIAAAGRNGKDAVLSRDAQRFEFRVRSRFQAEFSCERERAQAPCMPLSPLRLRFSAPVPKTLALQARLERLDAVAASGPPGATFSPKADDDSQDTTTELRFAAPSPENARLRLTLPPALRDTSGRALANAASFPLEVATGAMPPLAKFAAAPFGIVEASSRADEPALLPMTLRHVQAEVPDARSSGQLTIKRLDASATDAELLRWLSKVERHHERQVRARDAGLPQDQWTTVETVTDGQGRKRQVKRERWLATREVSLLAGEAGVRTSALPQIVGSAPRATEVIGIPLPERGYHVVELRSQILGSALLESRAPMFVRAGVLVTNLAVHFKRGATNSLVWVTTLDRGRPVAGAQLAVNDCKGQPLWTGTSDANGLARVERSLPDEQDASCLSEHGLLVSARLAGDVALVFSRWNAGIEPWRFALPYERPDGNAGTDTLNAHTVFDRTLLRTGETVGMKHFVRRATPKGLALAGREELPSEVVITHVGSGRQTVLPLAWPRGARSTESSWTVPPAAALGRYDVELRNPQRSLASGSLRVEAFRVPLLDARLAGPQGPQFAPTELTLAAQVNAMAGGPMAQQALSLSALLRPRALQFAGYEEFRFDAPGGAEAGGGDPDMADDSPRSAPGERLIAQALPGRTDAQGAARFVLKDLKPQRPGPHEVLAELSFADPNGETQTVQQRVALWPAALVLGLRTQSWALVRGRAQFQVVVLDTAGKPQPGRKVEVTGLQHRTLATRKRIVGGFYAYDQTRESKPLGSLCSGKTDASGLLACDVALDGKAASGEVEFVARAQDDAGRAAEAASTLWVAGDGDGDWFAQGNDDRTDLLPEKRELEPGQSARLQVRMPYREATALVTVEREGVIDSRVVVLRGREPVVEVPIPAPRGDQVSGWSPNVVVSLLVLRGRLREAPWWSFFRWGWREPGEWWRAFRYEGQDWRAPTATVDLARPSHKIGAVALKIGRAEHRLDVVVTPERSQYRVRETVRTTVKVTSLGKPLAGTEVAFAAIDDGLLALAPNGSWDLLEAMLPERPWRIETATALGEVIGRRHYGRKALPPGGGGGRGGTRELFDTRLLWRAHVVLDANGEARIDVPLNDSLTRFRLVAVADAGGDRFGTGSASVTVSQDLQMLPGLPPLAREGDRFDAGFTLRNTTARAMTVQATLAGDARSGVGAMPMPRPEPQTVALAPGAAQEVHWNVTVPMGAERIEWTAAVQEQGGAARDAVKLQQAVQPVVPVRAWQGQLVALASGVPVPVAPPVGALPGRGGLGVGLQARLGADLPGLRRWFEQYPYRCLEQRSARAIGLRDKAMWAELGDQVGTYLDADGLASYFPVRAEDEPRGSDRLTAHLLAVAHEAGWAWPEPAREAMLRGLQAFVEGRLERRFEAPRQDRDMRRLAALEALARHGRADVRWLATVDWAPGTVANWPTSALLEAWSLLQRLPSTPEVAARLAAVQQQVRGRLVLGGSTLRFATEDSDAWWWLMDGPDGNAARLLLAAVATPAWHDDVPRIVTGALARQQGGAWNTTVANVWGVLALERFSARFEARPPTGRSRIELGAASAAVDWSATPEGGRHTLPWPTATAALVVRHEGEGRPWLAWQALAAVPLTEPVASGYRIVRSVGAVQRKTPEAWSRGDLLRVRLEIEAVGDMAWVVVSDPLPTGATALGTGLGRDSAIATRDETRSGNAWPAFEERGPGHFRAYYRWLPRGRHVVEYTLRLNNAGRFGLPASRVEAMYAPENFAETPNAVLEVRP